MKHYHHLLELINKLNLKKYIKINPNFLTDTETLNRLSNTDLVIFPYQETNESASGAVRQAISSSAPVAVTPLSIFDDVLDVVYKLPGCSPSSIAAGLIDWMNNCYSIPMTDRQKKWRDEHSFNKLAIRLQCLIKSIEINNS